MHASEPILKKMKHDGRKKNAESTDQNSNDPNPPIIRLFKARHPLIDPSNVVSNDIDLAPGTRAVIITGPNTGGKTVSLKTVGLLAVMAQSGLHIPAQSGSEISIFQDIFADIGDEQSIEQSLSTFSSHITNIIRILKQIDTQSLVILDELGAGTDPQEGAALARAIVSHLLERGSTTFVATHYPELKTFAHSTPGVVNASLEFDVATLRPTYRLTIGLPGRSNALAIAARLGLSENIIADARKEINPDELRADRLLDDIRKERNRTSREREKTEKARQRTEELNKSLTNRLENIEDERREVIALAKAEAELEVELLKRNIGRLKAEMKRLRQPLDALEILEAKVEKVEEKTRIPVERQSTVMESRSANNSLKLGEKVIISTLGSEGIITALNESEAEVQVGSLRIRARLSDLHRKGDEANVQSGIESKTGHIRRIKKMADNMHTSQKAAFGPPIPSMELDLRGQTAEDALTILENYLDQAYMAGMPFVRIIHGKGTGKLRQEIRAALKGHNQVASFEEGHPNEGGDGVTVVKIIKE